MEERGERFPSDRPKLSRESAVQMSSPGVSVRSDCTQNPRVVGGPPVAESKLRPPGESVQRRKVGGQSKE